MINYASRRLQPLKERAHFAYEYTGPDFDTTREVPEPAPAEDLLDRIRSCFVPGTHITSLWGVAAVQPCKPAARGEFPFRIPGFAHRGIGHYAY
jgi:hypothetical protein